MGAADRIRKYILNLMIHHAGESIKIPSYNELAPRLGVARSSVQLVLKQLTKEGYIESKVGIGTWSCPQALLPHYNLMKTRLAGIVVGNGRFVFNHYSSWLPYAGVGDAIARRSWFQQTIALESQMPEEVFSELMNLQLDVLIWIAPPRSLQPIIVRMAKELPIVVVSSVVKGVSCVGFDEPDEGIKIASKMEQLKVERLVCSPCFCVNGIRLASLKKRFKGKELVCLTDSSTFEEKLKALFEDRASQPDMVIVNPEEYESCAGLMGRYLPRPERRLCGVVFPPPSPLPQPVACLTYDFHLLGEKAVELVMKQYTAKEKLEPEIIYLSSEI